MAAMILANHIIAVHYNVVYGCRKCLKAVLFMGQTLKLHLKTCPGFLKDDTASSSNQESTQPVTWESPCHVSKHLDTKPNSAKESTSHAKESGFHRECKKSYKKCKD